MAAREQNEAAEDGHTTEAEDLNRGCPNDASCLGVTEKLKHVPKYQLVGAQIARGIPR
jgi:hypothetical protein